MAIRLQLETRLDRLERSYIFKAFPLTAQEDQARVRAASRLLREKIDRVAFNLGPCPADSRPSAAEAMAQFRAHFEGKAGGPDSDHSRSLQERSTDEKR